MLDAPKKLEVSDSLINLGRGNSFEQSLASTIASSVEGLLRSQCGWRAVKRIAQMIAKQEHPSLAYLANVTRMDAINYMNIDQRDAYLERRNRDLKIPLQCNRFYCFSNRLDRDDVSELFPMRGEVPTPRNYVDETQIVERRIHGRFAA
jgi:hypothetical protein